MFALKGDCGTYAWQVEWNPWHGFVHLRQSLRGYIVQKVCIKRNETKCPGATLVNNNLVTTRPRNGKALSECPDSCYFELWRVYDGEIYSGSLRNTPTRAGIEGTDTFAWLGFANALTSGCTFGDSEQTGWSFFIDEMQFGPTLKNQFSAGTNGIAEAGILFSVCVTPQLEQDLLRASRKVQSGAAAPAFPLPTNTKP